MPPSKEERIAAATAKFVDRAAEDAAYLQSILADCVDDWEPIAVDIRGVAHRLAGTAGSFGFMKVSAAAVSLVATIERRPSKEDLSFAIRVLSTEISQMSGDRI